MWVLQITPPPLPCPFSFLWLSTSGDWGVIPNFGTMLPQKPRPASGRGREGPGGDASNGPRDRDPNRYQRWGGVCFIKVLINY